VTRDEYEIGRRFALTTMRFVRRAKLQGSASAAFQKQMIEYGQRKLARLRRSYYKLKLH